MNKLGDRIQALRKKNGLTQLELAQKLDTRKQTIGKYETGIVTNIPLSRIQKLADALDTTPEYLLGFSNEEFDRYQKLMSDPSVKALITKLLSIPPAKRSLFLAKLDQELSHLDNLKQ